MFIYEVPKYNAMHMSVSSPTLINILLLHFSTGLVPDKKCYVILLQLYGQQ